MRMQQFGARELIIGAAVGSVVGGISALLVAPKSGKKLRADLYDSYLGLIRRTQPLVKKSKNALHRVMPKKGVKRVASNMQVKSPKKVIRKHAVVTHPKRKTKKV